jgi:hypothetical protein
MFFVVHVRSTEVAGPNPFGMGGRSVTHNRVIRQRTDVEKDIETISNVIKG